METIKKIFFIIIVPGGLIYLLYRLLATLSWLHNVGAPWTQNNIQIAAASAESPLGLFTRPDLAGLPTGIVAPTYWSEFVQGWPSWYGVVYVFFSYGFWIGLFSGAAGKGL